MTSTAQTTGMSDMEPMTGDHGRSKRFRKPRLEAALHGLSESFPRITRRQAALACQRGMPSDRPSLSECAASRYSTLRRNFITLRARNVCPAPSFLNSPKPGGKPPSSQAQRLTGRPQRGDSAHD